MKKWGKWVLGCCVCLIVVCAMGTTVLAGENQGIDETQALGQRLEEAEQRVDELTVQIEELREWTETIGRDTLKDEFDRIEDKLIGWIQAILTAVGFALIVATFWGTFIAPRQAERALIKKTEDARNELEKAKEELENANIEQAATIEKISSLKQDYEALRGEYDTRIEELEQTQILINKALEEMRENLNKSKEQSEHVDQTKNEIDAKADAILHIWEGHFAYMNKKYKEAASAFGKATAINPQDDTSLNNWGYLLNELAGMKQGKEKEDLHRAAIEKYERAIEINPQYDAAWNNWGWALDGLADMKQGKEKENLHQAAIKKYERVIEMNPQNITSWNNWGYALNKLAGMKQGKEKENLCREAIKKYKRAIEINPQYYLAWSNWGYALNELARMKQDTTAEELYRDACEKFEKAVHINPVYSNLYRHWGNALAGLARLKLGEETKTLFQEAVSKYSKAVEIELDYYQAWEDWGEALTRLAEMTKDENKKKELLRQADEKFKRAEEIKKRKGIE